MAGCEEDVPSGGKQNAAGLTVGKDVVAFYLGGNTTATRAANVATIVAPTNTIDLPAAEGDDTPLCLVETVSSLDEPAVDATMATRGTPVYTENFEDYGGGMKAAAVYETTSGNARGDLITAFEYVSTDKYGVSLWKHFYNENEAWPTEGALRYFLQAPATMPNYVENLAFNKSNGKITFSLKDYPTTATAQEDILFTYKDITAPTGDENPTYAILFYHAFTGVKFKLGNAGDGITAITKVEMTNMLNDGNCTVAPNYTDMVNTSMGSHLSNHDVEPTDDSKSAQCSTWANTTGNATFSQEFGDYKMGQDITSGNSNFAPSFYDKEWNNADESKRGKDKSAEDNLNDLHASMTFFCIPRTFSYNAENTANDIILTVTYTMNDGESKTRQIDFTKVLAANGTQWKAGELYTYTLTINDVDVEVVEDEFTNDEDTEKTNVKAKNTGNCNAYIRAAIVANWYDLSERIVNVPWNLTDELAHFTDLATDASNWVKGADGFYYYKLQVKPGQNTNGLLFNKYTTYHCDKYNGTTHLKMTIVAQAIQATKLLNEAGTALKTQDTYGWDTSVLTTAVETPAAE